MRAAHPPQRHLCPHGNTYTSGGTLAYCYAALPKARIKHQSIVQDQSSGDTPQSPCHTGNKGRMVGDVQQNSKHHHTVEHAGFVPLNSQGDVSNFATHKTLKSIA